MSGVAIHQWNQVNCLELCETVQAIGFDLDTTLAVSKQPMTPAMAERFSALTHLIPCAVVSGGKFSLFEHQILAMIGERAQRSNLHLMPTSGTRYYAWRDGEWECQYTHDLSEQDRDAAIESLTRHAKEQGLWLDDGLVRGERIEDRGSQITFSALGQLASPADKEAWDPDRAKKNHLAAAVAVDLPQLTVRSGGSTSIDVCAKGIDKSYAMRQLSHILGIDIPRIAFIGDRMDPDGNDYPVAVSGAYAIRITNPNDTLHLIDRMIEALSR